MTCNPNTAQNTTTLHGVFMRVNNIGVLLDGPSGSGKSQLALSLLNKGHQLIADDSIMTHISDGKLIGTCPPLLQDYLAPRHLGLINVRNLFGANSICSSQPIELMIKLKNDTGLLDAQNFQSAWSPERLFSISIMTLTLPTNNPHLLALTETAARCYNLARKKVPSTAQFLQQHQHALNQNARSISA